MTAELLTSFASLAMFHCHLTCSFSHNCCTLPSRI